jgi:hypothetical protein
MQAATAKRQLFHLTGFVTFEVRHIDLKPLPPSRSFKGGGFT